VKVTGDSTGTIYGLVTSSTYSSQTAINFRFDSGSLSNETLTPFISALTASNPAVPKDLISVKDFGAVGDGQVDDTTALQNAINYAQGNGISLFFPDGVYLVTATLNINDGQIALIGAHNRQTQILHSGDYGDTLYIADSSPTTTRVQDVSIEGLRFFVASGATLPTSGAHIHMVRPQSCSIRNCKISEHFGGIHCEGGAGVILSDIEVNSGNLFTGAVASSYLMKFASATTSGTNEFPGEITCNNFNVRDGGSAYIQDGIIVEACDGIWFSNGHVGFVSGSCFLVEPQVAGDSLNGLNCSNVHFDGNSQSTFGLRYTEQSLAFHTGANFAHNYTGCQFSICTTGMSLNMDGLSGCVITGGRFENNDEWGLRISRGSGVSVVNAVMKANGSNSAGTGNALIENDVTDVNMHGVFKGTAYRGVQITGTADRINVDGVFQGLTAEDVINSSAASNKQYNVTGTTDTSIVLASASTLTIPDLGRVFQITGTTGITQFSGGGAIGRVSLTVSDGNNLLLSGDFNATQNDTITLVDNGSNWIEIARSAN
jgi:hypothetical protein